MTQEMKPVAFHDCAMLAGEAPTKRSSQGRKRLVDCPGPLEEAEAITERVQ